MYKFKTIIYDYNGKAYYRKHKTENQMKSYIQSMLNKGNCYMLFAYHIEDTNNQYPYIRKYI